MSETITRARQFSLLALLLCALCVSVVLPSALNSSLPAPPARPKITGIDHVRLYVSDIEKSREFYSKLFGIRLKGGMCFDTSNRCFTVGWAHDQTIDIEQAPTADTRDLLAEIAIATDNIELMRNYLVSNGVAATKITKDNYGKSLLDSHFEVRDPEGHLMSFIQRSILPTDDPPPGTPWYVQIIHAGFVVHDRAAEDKFYKDILGFHVYWHGGMKDDETNWVDMQVPDGTDWLEYMLNVPPNADKHTLGVMNHIALGVPDIHAAQQQLIKNGWKGTEQPKIGRDGKWQLNLYDPDDTRVELMEFSPVEKPCCSEYTGPHPKP
jgi:catechol 2,3-dioxygenase-like lactoylglutathione lyase family enzyme